MKNVLLNLLAFTTIFSSVLVITSKNPVVAVIFLISVFLCSAELLLELGVGFVGLSYIILYVGAIIVLFLFVLMSINIKLTDILEAGSQYTKNIPLALSIGLLFTYELINLFPFNIKNISILEIFVEILKVLNELFLGTPSSSLSNLFTVLVSPIDTKIFSFLQIESLALFLYTDGFLFLIISALILLLSLAAPIFISRNNKDNGAHSDLQSSIVSMNTNCADSNSSGPSVVGVSTSNPVSAPLMSALAVANARISGRDTILGIVQARKVRSLPTRSLLHSASFVTSSNPKPKRRWDYSVLKNTIITKIESYYRFSLITLTSLVRPIYTAFWESIAFLKQTHKNIVTSLIIPISPNQKINKTLLILIVFNIIPSLIVRLHSVLAQIFPSFSSELALLVQVCVIILALILPILLGLFMQRIVMVVRMSRELFLSNQSTEPSDLNYSVIFMFLLRALSIIFFSGLGIYYTSNKLIDFWAIEILLCYFVSLKIYMIYYYHKYIRNNEVYGITINSTKIQYTSLSFGQYLIKIITALPIFNLFSGFRLLGSLFSDIENVPGETQNQSINLSTSTETDSVSTNSDNGSNGPSNQLPHANASVSSANASPHGGEVVQAQPTNVDNAADQNLPIYGPAPSPLGYSEDYPYFEFLKNTIDREGVYYAVLKIWELQVTGVISTEDARHALLLLAQESYRQDPDNNIIPLHVLNNPVAETGAAIKGKVAYLNGIFSYRTTVDRLGTFSFYANSNILEVIKTLHLADERRMINTLGERKTDIIRRVVTQYNLPSELANPQTQSQALVSLLVEKRKSLIINCIRVMNTPGLEDTWLEFENGKLFIAKNNQTFKDGTPTKVSAIRADSRVHLGHVLKNALRFKSNEQITSHLENFKSAPIVKYTDLKKK